MDEGAFFVFVFVFFPLPLSLSLFLQHWPKKCEGEGGNYRILARGRDYGATTLKIRMHLIYEGIYTHRLWPGICEVQYLYTCICLQSKFLQSCSIALERFVYGTCGQISTAIDDALAQSKINLRMVKYRRPTRLAKTYDATQLSIWFWVVRFVHGPDARHDTYTAFRDDRIPEHGTVAPPVQSHFSVVKDNYGTGYHKRGTNRSKGSATPNRIRSDRAPASPNRL